MPSTQIPGLYIVGDGIKKRCVYCAESINKGSTIELCPVIILSKKDTEMIHKTALHDYYFLWDLELGSSAIALGFGSLYNHSEQANTAFDIVPADDMIRFTALRDIPAGEELCIDYIGLKDTGATLWFDVEED